MKGINNHIRTSSFTNYKSGIFFRTSVMVIRVVILFLFTYTLVNKLFDVRLFVASMQLQPFPMLVSRILIWVVPLAEGMISLLLLFDKTTKIAFWLAFVVLSAFTIYVSFVVFGFYHKIPCPCGGIISGLSWTGHLLFNLLFLTITAIGLMMYHGINTSKKYCAIRRSRTPV